MTKPGDRIPVSEFHILPSRDRRRAVTVGLHDWVPADQVNVIDADTMRERARDRDVRELAANSHRWRLEYDLRAAERRLGTLADEVATLTAAIALKGPIE